MTEEAANASFAKQLTNMAQYFDAQIGDIIESSTGKTADFRIGRIITSLFESGLDFYSALDVISSIEHLLRPGLETKTISSAIITELQSIRAEWAREFSVRYGEGTVISLKDMTKVPLCMAEVRKAATAYLGTMGYSWDQQLSEVTRNVFKRCQRLGVADIAAQLLDQIIESELREKLSGSSIAEYIESMPSTIVGLREAMSAFERGDDDDIPNIVHIVNQLCHALLFHFSVIPPIGISDCLLGATILFDKAREPNHALRSALIVFLTTGNANSYTLKYVQGKKQPIDFVIDQAKSSLRKLSAIANDHNSLSLEQLRHLDREGTIFGTLMVLLDLCTFLWPEDWLAASTLQELRHHILRCLFRYRCLSTIKLTRMLQVHPKHTARALVPLQREGLIAVHHVQDGDLVLITLEGESYCEHNLSLKLRCSLSSL